MRQQVLPVTDLLYSPKSSIVAALVSGRVGGGLHNHINAVRKHKSVTIFGKRTQIHKTDKNRQGGQPCRLPYTVEMSLPTYKWRCGDGGDIIYGQSSNET